jgi:hypothetical protein
MLFKKMFDIFKDNMPISLIICLFFIVIVVIIKMIVGVMMRIDIL